MLAPTVAEFSTANRRSKTCNRTNKPLGRRYPENSVGWYRRAFDIPASHAGRRILLEFDGAFRSALIFVNGCFIGRQNRAGSKQTSAQRNNLPTSFLKVVVRNNSVMQETPA